MRRELPDHLKQEQRAVEEEIRSAFKGVRRAGGVSWSESREIDNYETEEVRARARALDKDSCWEELVDDPSWDPYAGVGGFSFLDAIGYTYYLPPTMIRDVQDSAAEDHPYRLGPLRNQARLFSERQALAVVRFLRHMIAAAEWLGDDSDADGYREALENWRGWDGWTSPMTD